MNRIRKKRNEGTLHPTFLSSIKIKKVSALFRQIFTRTCYFQAPSCRFLRSQKKTTGKNSATHRVCFSHTSHLITFVPRAYLGFYETNGHQRSLKARYPPDTANVQNNPVLSIHSCVDCQISPKKNKYHCTIHPIKVTINRALLNFEHSQNCTSHSNATRLKIERLASIDCVVRKVNKK